MERPRGEAIPGRALRLNEQVALELARRIQQGLIRPGDHLVELKLAEELGLSRSPVRLALRSLERRGLVTWETDRGFIVAESAGGGNRADSDDEAMPLFAAASWEAIYDDVSKKLVARAAFGCWRIIESDLAAGYGVSRTVAREVLARLEHVGVIRKDHRSRWVLPALTHERICQLYEMRWILEPIALRTAAPRVTPELLRAMRDELEAVQAQDALPPPSEFDRLERRLHVDLLSSGTNEVLLESLQHFHALLVTNAQLYEATRSAFGMDPFVGEHHEIIEILIAGRPARAAERLEHHLKIALDRAIARVDYMVANNRFEPLAYLRPTE